MHGTDSYLSLSYKMKLEAMKRQGSRSDITSCQVGTKSRTDEKIAIDADESARQIQRYIRLTNLIPEILQYVDEGRIAFTPAVELSYLTEEEQYALLEQIELNDCTPSLSQACRLKKMSQAGTLQPTDIEKIMSEEKANQKERVRIPIERLQKFFPKSYTVSQIEDEIVKLCEAQYRRRMSRDER